MSEETYRKLMVIFAGAFVFTFIVTCALFLKFYAEQSRNGRFRAVPRHVVSWPQNHQIRDPRTNTDVWVPKTQERRTHAAFDTRTGRFAP